MSNRFTILRQTADNRFTILRQTAEVVDEKEIISNSSFKRENPEEINLRDIRQRKKCKLHFALTTCFLFSVIYLFWQMPRLQVQVRAVLVSLLPLPSVV